MNIGESASTLSIALALVGYSLCSSTMLLANKMAVSYLPAPAVVSLIQLIFGSLAVITIKLCGWSDVDWFEWDKVKAYSFYVLIFVSAMYTNMQALQHSNVETVIVFRAVSPLAVCVCDVVFMGREYPSTRSILSLSAIVLGAVIYCLSDSELALNGISAYYWVMLYFVLIVMSMTYGKQLTNNVEMRSVWGPVLYSNVLSLPPLFLLSLMQGDLEGAEQHLSDLSAMGKLVLLFSCIVGTLIGYTGWLCRDLVSATTYTLVGVVNKFLTVILNVVIWDKHSTPLGLFGVCLCLLAGVFYQQAPLRTLPSPLRAKDSERETD